jgi:ribosomal protein S18 acetylase RimI-like enzyme
VDIRPARSNDVDSMIGVMLTEPGVEQVAFMPSIDGAKRFFSVLWSAHLADFIVADDGGTVVGFAWCSEHDVSLGEGARAAVSAWGMLGPVRLAARGWPRQLVETSLAAGTKLIELQAHPQRRGSGIGTALLTRIIDANGDRSLSLSTRSDNPARRLYERHGFVVTREKRHRAYERRTGSPGRITMVRSV